MTKVENENQELNDFNLEQNYPNPFNSQTRIRFSLKSKSGIQLYRIKLKIVNLLGEEIFILIDEEKASGTYEVIFDTSKLQSNNFSSGIYFYQLQINEKSFTKKMVYLK